MNADSIYSHDSTGPPEDPGPPGKADMDAEALFKTYLKRQGLKLTRERRIVLHEIMRHPGHLDADELLVNLHGKKNQVSRATIYRTLDLLVASGLLWKVSLGGNQAHYEYAIGAEHHGHLICVECGRVFEFANHDIEELQRKVCRELRFSPVRHSLEIFGYCSDCGGTRQ